MVHRSAKQNFTCDQMNSMVMHVAENIQLTAVQQGNWKGEKIIKKVFCGFKLRLFILNHYLISYLSEVLSEQSCRCHRLASNTGENVLFTSLISPSDNYNLNENNTKKQNHQQSNGKKNANLKEITPPILTITYKFLFRISA